MALSLEVKSVREFLGKSVIACDNLILEMSEFFSVSERSIFDEFI